MIVNRAIIKNAKTIKFLDAKFRNSGDKAISIPYNVISAPNGQGKTTLLECLSLIGHLPCMTRATATVGGWRVSPSYIGEAMGNNQSCSMSIAAPTGKTSLLDWFTKEDFPRLTAVYFDLRDNKHERQKFEFVVIILQNSGHGITDLLSQNFGDDQFADHSCLICLEDHESNLLELVKRVDRGRIYIDSNNAIIRDVRNDIDALFVSFVNTDMNDFGRGNDLRESPKLLNSDFENEIIKRIGFPSPESNSAYSDNMLNEINNAISRIMETGDWQFDTPNVVTSRIFIQNIIKDNQVLKLFLKKERFLSGDEMPSEQYFGDYLSAGENEIFFILLILKRFAGKDAIILLDEPDLHVAGYMRDRLFREIKSSVDFEKQHLIVSSHSAASMRSAVGNRKLARPHSFGGIKHNFLRKIDPFLPSDKSSHAKTLIEIPKNEPPPQTIYLLTYDSRYYWSIVSGYSAEFGSIIRRLPLFWKNIWGFCRDVVNQVKDNFGGGLIFVICVTFIAVPAFIAMGLLFMAFGLIRTPPGMEDFVHIENRQYYLSLAETFAFPATLALTYAFFVVSWRKIQRVWNRKK